jgi:hypothetical protein
MRCVERSELVLIEERRGGQNRILVFFQHDRNQFE